MKNYYLLLFLFIGFLGKAQILTIPDANFKAKLIQANYYNYIAKDLAGNYFKIDSNNDSEISPTEALQVGSLYLEGSNIFDLTGIENFTNIVDLTCFNNYLTTLNISSLTQLKELNITNNDIVSLNLSNLSQLKNLLCSKNNIVSLDVSNLIYLEKIVAAEMVSLNAINANGCTALKNITASNDSQLSTLNTNGCPNLYAVSIEACNLTALDFSGKTHLSNIYADQGKLTSLNVSGCTSLYAIYANSNDLVSLNVTGCSSLYYIDVNNSELSSLNVSGCTSLNGLYAVHNQLTSLNVSGCTSLTSLYLSNNSLSTIDLSGCPILSTVFLQDNDLVTIFAKNGANESLYLNNNPTLQYICVDDNQISAVQSSLNQFGYSNCVLNTYCSFTLGGTFYTIQGNSKFDNENDGCDSTDDLVPSFKFSITNGTTTGQFISNATGNYAIPVPAGNHTVTPILENPSYFTISPSSFVASFPSQTSPFTQNFCISPNGIHHDVEIVILPMIAARPGFNATYKIIYKNKGNQTENGVINFQFDDAVVDLVSSNPTFISQSTNNLTWSYNNLLPFETREIVVVFEVNSPMDTPAVNGGDVLNYTAQITQLGSDEMINDSTFSLRQIVVNSFDPNDKTCLQGNTISPDKVGEYVHYMIRFENTGTFPAENIVVKDMIDTAKFDVSSLIPLQASHNYVTRISGNKIEFIFENINLPFDDANNDGYIAFKIKTLPSLVLGDTFSNLANIYFDYNFPIITNTATTTVTALSNPSFVFANYFSLYPNPVVNELNINLKTAVEIHSIQIYNTIGQLVTVQTGNALKVDVSHLKTGNYFIKINTNEGYSTSQFIKE